MYTFTKKTKDTPFAVLFSNKFFLTIADNETEENYPPEMKSSSNTGSHLHWPIYKIFKANIPLTPTRCL